MGMIVSIPWSEFGWFGPAGIGEEAGHPIGFNSLVGIRLVWTCPPGECPAHQADVSIPWSEFGWFGREQREEPPHHKGQVSIPWSEFGWFGPTSARRGGTLDQFQFLGRNSVGLDYEVEHCEYEITPVSIPWSEFGWFGLFFSEHLLWDNIVFQFLGRNSVGLDSL